MINGMKARRETYGCSKTRASQWEGVRTQYFYISHMNFEII